MPFPNDSTTPAPNHPNQPLNRQPTTPTAKPNQPQERFYFGDAVMPLFESGVPLLLERLRGMDDWENVTIAYPDDGAWKRFHALLQGLPEVRLLAISALSLFGTVMFDFVL